jgi:hypothetical protein
LIQSPEDHFSLGSPEHILDTYLDFFPSLDTPTQQLLHRSAVDTPES